ncbi:BET4 [Candida theae]|uniref:Geranylgeranyl transferase type-2 subunit alpha n=1 Tax=Candida theae TaxID=1198502 RepID=A0AAD5BC89_9ASCO|nr:BET4 [Candida theae]KAI5954731.1 BET4 [Candida theae]
MQHEVKRVHLNESQKHQKYVKDEPKIKHYRDLTSHIFQLRDLQTYNDESFNATTSLLQLNPEFYTIWNYRREIIENAYGSNHAQLTQILNDELKFVMAQLRKFPKVYWIWNHRRWCLFKLVDLKQVNWGFEFKTVGKMLELDQRNFHGWQYRRFVVENLELEKLKSDQGDDEVLRLNLDEFDYTTAKISIDFSNFSAWHNRTKLIPKIYELAKQNPSSAAAIDHPSLHLFQSPLSILNNDLELIKTGIYMSPEDNSVWSYLYWLLSDEFFVNAFNASGADNDQNDYKQLLQQQIDLINEINELEKEDTGQENVGCLKALFKITELKEREDVNKDEMRVILQKLIKLDELRKGRQDYLDISSALQHHLLLSKLLVSSSPTFFETNIDVLANLIWLWDNQA